MGTRGITADQLAMYAGAMVTQQELAGILGVSQQAVSKMLQKPAYREAWERARSNTRLQLRQAQLEAAIVHKDRTALVWTGKQYLEQRDSPQTVDQNINVKVEYVAVWGGSAGELPPAEDEDLIEGEVLEEEDGDA